MFRDIRASATAVSSADPGRRTSHESVGSELRWRVVGRTDGVTVGKIALLACRPGDRKVDAIVTLDEPPSYAAVPVSALRRIGADVIAVAGRTGDQIKTEFKAQGDFTPFGTDKSLAELGETCR